MGKRETQSQRRRVGAGTKDALSKPEKAVDPVSQPTVALRDFSVLMPNLLKDEFTFSAMPHQIQVALAFLQRIRPQDYVRSEDLAHSQPLLPPQSNERRGRQTLVLDLDETLVHCHPSLLNGRDPPLRLRIDTCPPLNAHVYVRPAAKKFLEFARDSFEVVIFTASAAIYADQVLDWLDPKRNIISHRLYRQHCTEICGGHFKDLRRLGRSLDNVVLVDNSPLAAGMCPDNAILCSSWFGDDYDDLELEHLVYLLWTLRLQPSIPAFLTERFGFDAFLEQQRKKRQRLSDEISGPSQKCTAADMHMVVAEEPASTYTDESLEATQQVVEIDEDLFGPYGLGEVVDSSDEEAVTIVRRRLRRKTAAGCTNEPTSGTAAPPFLGVVQQWFAD